MTVGGIAGDAEGVGATGVAVAVVLMLMLVLVLVLVLVLALVVPVLELVVLAVLAQVLVLELAVLTLVVVLVFSPGGLFTLLRAETKAFIAAVASRAMSCNVLVRVLSSSCSTCLSIINHGWVPPCRLYWLSTSLFQLVWMLKLDTSVATVSTNASTLRSPASATSRPELMACCRRFVAGTLTVVPQGKATLVPATSSGPSFCTRLASNFATSRTTKRTARMFAIASFSRRASVIRFVRRFDGGTDVDIANCRRAPAPSLTARQGLWGRWYVRTTGRRRERA